MRHAANPDESRSWRIDSRNPAIGFQLGMLGDAIPPGNHNPAEQLVESRAAGELVDAVLRSGRPRDAAVEQPEEDLPGQRRRDAMHASTYER